MVSARRLKALAVATLASLDSIPDGSGEACLAEKGDCAGSQVRAGFGTLVAIIVGFLAGDPSAMAGSP